MFGFELQSLWRMPLKFNVWMGINLEDRQSSWRWSASGQRSNESTMVSCQSSTSMLAVKNGKSGCQRAPDWLCRVAVIGLHPRWQHWMMSSMMEMSLNVLSTDVQGTWLNAPMLEEIYAAARHELGAAKLVVGCYCLFVFHLVWSRMLHYIGTTWQPQYVGKALYVMKILTCGWDQGLSRMGTCWKYILSCVNGAHCIPHSESQVVMDYLPAKPTLRNGRVKQTWFLCENQSQEMDQWNRQTN